MAVEKDLHINNAPEIPKLGWYNTGYMVSTQVSVQAKNRISKNGLN